MVVKRIRLSYRKERSAICLPYCMFDAGNEDDLTLFRMHHFHNSIVHPLLVWIFPSRK